MKRIFTDWLFVICTVFPPLIKVFWKGEFEGKNLFFKKGRRGAAPSPRFRARRIIIAPVGRFAISFQKISKNFPNKGPACWRPKVFSRADEVRRRFLSRKERKERKEMEGGNEASAASGITQFAVRRTETSEVCKTIRRSRKSFWIADVSPPK